VRNTFFAFAPQKELQGLRYNNWKLVLDKRAGKTNLLLFDLATDAKENNNLAGANTKIVDALYALALQAQKAVEENKPLSETNSFNF
jgi:hypothetical protein